MLEPNISGPKFTDMYLVKWWQDSQWHFAHFNTLDEAIIEVKRLEALNMIWKLKILKHRPCKF